MCSTTPNTPKADDIAREHWRILREAIASLGDSEPRTPHVYKALDYFEARVLRKGGLNLARAGLRDGNAEYLQLGMKLLRRHLGGVVPYG
jgi:hypothetical protein